jgi:hypothetical protein
MYMDVNVFMYMCTYYMCIYMYIRIGEVHPPMHLEELPQSDRAHTAMGEVDVYIYIYFYTFCIHLDMYNYINTCE